MKMGRRCTGNGSAIRAGPASASELRSRLPLKRMSKRILVIAAHPDDELLGCGGTGALHSKAGDEVTSVIVCEGESLRYGQQGVGQADHIRKAAATLGVRDVRPL